MGNKKRTQKIIKSLFRAKELYHKEMAKLPFEEKIKILINLQKIMEGIPRLKKERQIAWQV